MTSLLKIYVTVVYDEKKHFFHSVRVQATFTRTETVVAINSNSNYFRVRIMDHDKN